MHLSAMNPVAGPPRGNALLSILLIWLPAIALLLMVGVGSVVFGVRGMKSAKKRAEVREQSRQERLVLEQESNATTTSSKSIAAADGTVAESGDSKSVAAVAAAPAFSEAELNAAMKAGKSKYITCQACHGDDGKGQPAPGMVFAPNFSESKIAGDDSAEAMTLAVLKGIQKEEGSKYMQMMLGLETALNDRDLAAVLTYVRAKFADRKDLVTEEEVKGWRAKYADQTGQVSRAELESLLSAGAEAAE